MIFINHTPNACLFYLYQYVRLDKNEPFYIGVGKRYKGKTDFTRAKQSHAHNSICVAIIAKTDYRIEIIEEHDDYNFIREREKHLIAEYGRKHNHTGILANMTAGGDGCLDHPNIQCYKKCYAYTKDGAFFKEFESITAAAKYFNVDDQCITLAMKRPDKVYLIKDHQFRLFKTNNIPAVLDIREKLSNRKSKPVTQLTREGEFVKEWKSAVIAAKELKITRSHIADCCLNVKYHHTAGGFKWKFKETIS